jgi:hypothetical protein
MVFDARSWLLKSRAGWSGGAKGLVADHVMAGGSVGGCRAEAVGSCPALRLNGGEDARRVAAASSPTWLVADSSERGVAQ